MTLKGWRTIAFNLIAMVVAILALPQWGPVIGQEYAAEFALFVAAVNIMLRYITTTPVGQADPDQ